MMRIELQGGSLQKYVSKVLLLLIVAVGVINCGKPTNNSCGFTLQEFEVINPQLKSLIVGILDSTTFTDRWYDERGNPETIPVIELIENDSVLEFGFVSASKGSLALKYIFEENKRIVGYLNIENETFIVLSNVDSQFEFYNTFYKFMIPAGGKQQFEYIYFPSYLYCPSENGIPCPPEFFDPYYYWYVYKDGEFIFQEDFTSALRSV